MLDTDDIALRQDAGFKMEDELGATVGSFPVRQSQRLDSVGEQPDAVGLDFEIKHDHSGSLGQREIAALSRNDPISRNFDTCIVSDVKPWGLGVGLHESDAQSSGVGLEPEHQPLL